MGQVPERLVDVGVVLGRPARPVRRVHGDAVVELGDLDVRQLGSQISIACRYCSVIFALSVTGVVAISSTTASNSLFVHFGKFARWARTACALW